MAHEQANVHVIVGDDDYLVTAAAKKIIAAAAPGDLQSRAVEIVEGAAANEEAQLAALRACTASLQEPPFFDPVKVTWWRNVTFLPGGNGRLGERVKAALEKFARDLAATPLPANQYLVVTAPKMLATSLVAKSFKSFAHLATFAGGKNARERRLAAEANLPHLAAEEGLTFAPGAADAFLAKVGTDTRTIVSELAKLRTYLGDDAPPATAADIAAISSPGGEEPELWAFTDAIGARNLPAAAALFAAFDGAKSAPILLATVLEKYFRELCLYRDAVDRGWITLHGWARELPADVQEALDAAGIGPHAETRTFITRRNAQAARNYTPRELRVARHRMLTVREKLVSSGATGEAVFAELLRILPRPRARAK